MSYSMQAKLARDNTLLLRVAACAATQGMESPERWASEQAWSLSAQPGWAEAYASAINSGAERPGEDEAVITDTMILAACRALQLPAGAA